MRRLAFASESLRESRNWRQQVQRLGRPAGNALSGLSGLLHGAGLG